MRLPYLPPYDVDQVMGFYAARAVAGVERVDGDTYLRTARTRRGAGLVRVTPARGSRAAAFDVELDGFAKDEQAAALERVRRMFNLDADPAALRRAFGRDALLGPCVKRRPGLRVPGGWDGYELAVRAILGQQVSVAAARTLAARLVANFGAPAPARFPAGLGALWPAPERLADADVAAIGLPASRAAAINTLARAVADGRLSFEPGQDLEEFIARCVALKGIGRWTAEYLAMRGLWNRDAFPAGDLVVRRVVSGDGPRLSERAVRERAEPWQPYRAYAVLHLWRSTAP